MTIIALFIGVVGTLVAARALGTRWPWEQAAAPVAVRASAHVSDSMFYRVPLNVASRVVAGMRRDGAALVWWHGSDGWVYLLFERRDE
jgi:hypothetical protein